MRSRVMRIIVLVALATLLTGVMQACAPATPQIVEKIVKETVVVEKEVAVEKKVVETVVVEKEVEKQTSWKDLPYIKVGSPGPFTGPTAGMGLDIKDGLNFAVERMNAAGGVLGKEIQVIYSDIKSQSSEECELAFEALTRENVAALFPGANFLGTACVHAAGQREPPTFHDCASKEFVDVVIANQPEYNNVFQMCASERYYGPNAYDVITGKLDYELPNKKAALLGGDITYDMYIQQAFKEKAEANGWEIILNDTYPYETTEFGPQLAKIRAENPSVIFGCLTSQGSAVAFMNQFLQNPTNSLVYIQWSPASPQFIGTLQEKANGIVWQTLVATLPTPENKQWEADFEARYGRLPGATLPGALDDHLGIWKIAVETCGDPYDFACVNDYIHKLADHPYKGRLGLYGMNAEIGGWEALNGTDWIPLHFLQIQDKRNVTLYLGLNAVEGTKFIVPPWIK
jgi:branched-chain amino acid transport system substrate-binding protein